MKTIVDSPGVVVPPPLIYLAIFLFSFALQGVFPISTATLHIVVMRIAAFLIILGSLAFNLPALWQFIKTKNTVITVKPANTLQTSGIYSVSRNPMYLGLLLLYIGLAILLGNWWTLALVPLLITIVTFFIIKREERYLLRRFNEPYALHKTKVRRWL